MDTSTAQTDSVDEIAEALGDHLLDTSSLAEVLDVSTRTLEAWRTRGGGPPYIRMARDGGRVRAVKYRPRAVARWLAAREVSSTSDPGGPS